MKWIIAAFIFFVVVMYLTAWESARGQSVSFQTNSSLTATSGWSTVIMIPTPSKLYSRWQAPGGFALGAGGVLVSNNAAVSTNGGVLAVTVSLGNSIFTWFTNRMPKGMLVVTP
jgi:hypothetical protein